MQNRLTRILTFLSFLFILTSSSAQNVGINCPVPASKLHIRGSANMPQFIIDAHGTQSNTNPLIKLRDVDGKDLLWIHADDTTNMFIGVKSGQVNNLGVYNTFIGKNVGQANTNGTYNTAVGARSLFQNTNGGNNAALGNDALYHNITGYSNVAVGHSTLYLNENGWGNTAIGTDALRNNDGGGENTGIGMWALRYNTNGAHNVASGYGALYANTIGTKNVAIGYQAMLDNVGGSNGTAVGYHAMYNCNDNASAFTKYDVAVGYEALLGAQTGNTGNYNTALGYQTMHANTTGSSNVATGYHALQNNTTGSTNTAIGYEALPINTTGANNTCTGIRAGFNNTTGGNNTAIGGYAYFTTAALNNTTCIGYSSGGVANTSNRIEIGNTSITWIGGEQTWSTYSDGRIKENVEANVPGLDFINRLRPVTYNLNIHRQNEMVYAGKKEEGEWPEKYDVEKMRITGFIAQEVAAAATATGYNFSGVDMPKDSSELYSIRYSDFVMPLVKAAQELAAGNEAQDAIIETLRNELAVQKAENVMLMQKFQQLEALMDAVLKEKQ